MKKSSRYLILLLMVIVGMQATASVPSGYYNNAKGKSDQALMMALHKIIKGHTKRSYKNLWTDFKTTDCNGTTIIDRYSNATFTYSEDQCGTYNAVGDCYNREHSIPNSWWGGSDSDTAYTDLQHMFPVDGWVNGQRGNYPFGDCNSGSSAGTGKVGSCSFSGYSGTVFEVADEYKGDFARVYFYFATRYMTRMSTFTQDFGSAVFSTSSYLGMTNWAINQLLDWHRNDPVSTLETTRNDAVYGIQHNRNPFIDNPELVEYIWGNMKGNAWNDGGSSTTSPTLTSPTNGSTINVGTNTGSGVSKTITVKGSDLSSALTISVSGTGFSVSTTSVSASAANSGTTVTVTYNGTASSATGTLTVSSSEVSATVNLTASYSSGGGGETGTTTIETWEGCTGYTSYSTSSIQGHAFNWTTSDVGIWTGDTHCNDALSCRFGKSSSSYIQMAEDVTNGASTVTFYAANWSSSEATPTLKVLYSTDGGSTWTELGSCTLTATWTQYTFTPNVTGSIRFKFQQTAGARFNIDDIAITSYSGGNTTTPTLTAPVDGSTVNVGTISATGTGSSVSKTITVSGSDLTKALNVSVSGTGFSVSPTTISAASANAGTTITVTYTSSTTGNATGTLTISSSEVSSTVNLTASKAANPTITAPVNGSTVNVGTIEATGSSVTKSITVKGSELSKALSISVSGIGFSVSPTSISADNANAGTTIQVTYSSTTAGNATGTLIIGSSEASVTVNLTASKIAMPVISISSISLIEAEKDGESSVVRATVSADDNDEDITLSVEGNFEISLNRYNWANTLTLDPTGEVFYIRLADTGSVGDYSGSLTASTSLTSAYADVEGVVNAKQVLIGDVNMDGYVTISDVTALIDFLLGGDSSIIDELAADVNSDGYITISDVTSLIDYLLGSSSAVAMTWDAMPTDGGIYIESYYGTETLEIYDLDAECQGTLTVTGNCTIELPAGIYLVSGETCSRKVVVK